ncbi:hypothetical protein BHU72_09420 [Desulfuribacillus stibiiarsenatis]|uniref:DNA-directed DNA polymerase n=1 Tax=Desulfuribacillus stibiiarsenatis TaxID=1390249 RepID=A0A1E5L2V1_9FIRM|nr:DNA polymerase/3'-5' exonuclease PolX [Desulfuribacillus stibiiarsenatis]OEH84427.1 hypothetical protein BHU72_09420 [Desulfuribacillus stibiiarsenatis]
MDNYTIAWYLKEMAVLKELKGESDFKILAYRNAANTVESIRESIKDMSTTRRKQIPGIGEKIANIITEYIDTGTIQEYEQLLQETPPDFLKMLKIHGVGPKSIRLLHKKLGITTLDQLEAAARARKIRLIDGIGAKFEFKVITGIERLKNPPKEFNLGSVLPLAKSLEEIFQKQELVVQVSMAGEIRRRLDVIERIDLVISSEDPEQLMDEILKSPMIRTVIAKESEYCDVLLEYSLPVPIRFIFCAPNRFFYTLHERTGSLEYLNFAHTLANDKGIDLETEWESEEQIFNSIDMPFIPPEIREFTFIEEFKKGDFPKLVELSDIKGDLHMHSIYSDGVHTIEEMAQQARELGYEYIAITDHSQSLKIAKGLTVERWKKQQQEIQRLNKTWKDFYIFSGTEMDILPNRTLDFDDDFLHDVDLVVASIHTGFQQDRKQQTEKFITALESPYVDILAHPTGRLIAKRPGYDLDIDVVFAKAKETNTCLEINSSPDRLDLNAEHARKAVKEYGLVICINTDSHDKQSMLDMELGVSVARRAGLEAKDILNTRTRDEISQYIKRNHR